MDTPPPTVRPATPDDAPALLALLRELAAFDGEEAVTAVPDELGPAIGWRRLRCWVAVDGDAIVGAALCVPSFSPLSCRPTLQLASLVVAERHRRRGAGTALLAAVAAFAAGRYHGLDVQARADDPGAQAFLVGHGATARERWRPLRFAPAALERLAAAAPAGAAERDAAADDELLVVNLAEAPALAHPRRATLLCLEPDERPWPDTGVNVQIMQPGQPNCRYHSEPVQEDFLVLSGTPVLIVEGQERQLRPWDFVHCPAGVAHVFAGAGDGPSAVLMIGSRREVAAHYPVDATAARYDASVQQATDDPDEAYADWRREPRRPVPSPWPLR